MKKLKIVLMLALIFCATSTIVSAFTYSFVNLTPYPVHVKLDIALAIDQYQLIAPGESYGFKTGSVNWIHGFKVEANIGGTTTEVLKVVKRFIGNDNFFIFVEPKIERQPIPGGYSDVLKNVTFYWAHPGAAKGPIIGSDIEKGKTIDLIPSSSQSSEAGGFSSTRRR